MSCSYFNKREPQSPIIPDNSRGVTTFAIIPSRRLVILKPTPTTEQEKMAFGENKIDDIFFPKQICGEPPPDVSDNIATAISEALSAKGNVAEKGSLEFASNFAKSLSTTAVLLFKRTQGLQLYRDGMYNLCLAVMNGQIGNRAEYDAAAKSLLAEAVKLIEKEIPYMQATAAEVSAQNAATSATEAKKAAVDAKQSADAADAATKRSSGGGTGGGATGGESKPNN